MSRHNHTLCLLGGSADETALLGRLLGSRADAAWKLGDAANADVLCVDVDSVYGHMDWLKAQSSGRPVVALSSTDPHGAEYHLRKPLGSAALFGLLDQIATRLPRISTPAPSTSAPSTSAPVTRNTTPITPPAAAVNRPAPVPSAPAPAPAAAPESAAAVAVIEPPAPKRGPQTLLDLLDSPVASRVRLVAKDLQPIVLDGEDRVACAPDTALKAMTGWCTRTLEGVTVEPLDAAAFATATRDLATLPYARLSWLAHLVGSDGRLEAELDPAGRYKLARWPQSEREFPRHFRIATAMMKAPATLDEIVATSGASAEDVANFINAYHSSGHVEVESATKNAPVEQRRSGLFGRNRKNVEE